MANNIPDGITRDHLLESIRLFDAGKDHRFSESTVYDVLHSGRRYPPKAIVGIACEMVAGREFTPYDFAAGQASKCFRTLETNGFKIVLKSGAASASRWILQGNPDRFDIEDYLARYSYVYWRAPRFRSELKVGDDVFIWRSGENAGLVASGRIAEAPRRADEVNFPDALGTDLWRGESDAPDAATVGIEIDEARHDMEDGFVPRRVFKEDPILVNCSLIKSPQGTVFKLTEEQFQVAKDLWEAPRTNLPSGAVHQAMEGSLVIRKHYARERSRLLIRRKKEQFRKEHDGQVYCEVCTFNFREVYPDELGDGFIEVHHLLPLFSQDKPRRTTLDDLMLVCSNCHRMIHRTLDAEGNLLALQKHFERRRGSTRASAPMQRPTNWSQGDSKDERGPVE